MHSRRKEGQEIRNGELFMVIADRGSDGAWQFFEKSTWEPTWYPCEATPERLRWANQQDPDDT